MAKTHSSPPSKESLQSNEALKGFDAFMAWATFNPWTFRFLGLLASLLVMGFLARTIPNTFQHFDERSDALTWNLSSSTPLERRLVVVDVDEKSVEALGAWPWPRSTMAQLVDALNGYGVGLKLFDVVMPDSKEGDQALVKALSTGGPSIGGQIISLDPQVRIQSGALSKPLPAINSSGSSLGTCNTSIQNGFGFMGNAPALLGAYAAVGHLTPVLDPDGGVRHVPAMLCLEGQAYPALSVAALSQLVNNSSPTTQPRVNVPFVVKGKSLAEAPWSLKFTDMPELSIPLNEEGQIRVSYRVPKNGFISLSAVDVIQRKVPPELLNNVWALVGSTAFGSGDAIPTPHGGAEGGLEIHAQLIAAALDEATPYTPKGFIGVEIGLAALGLLILLGLSLVSSPDRKPVSERDWHQGEWWGFALPAAGLLLVGALYAVHAWLLLEHHLWMSWSLVATSVALGALVLSSQHLMVLRWQRTRVFENLSRYMSEPVARDVALASKSEEVVAVQSRVIVMSVNLRNFDRFCASQAPELSAKLLHQYLSLLNTQVRATGGQLQHIQGPEALAVWSDMDQVGLAQQVVGLSQALWTKSQDWLVSWGVNESEQMRKDREKGSDGKLHHSSLTQGQTNTQLELVPTTYIADSIRMGRELQLEMGLECGVVLMGSMGPSERRFNTVLGEPVQTAHALREMCSELAYPSLLGPELFTWLQLEMHRQENSSPLLGDESSDFNPIKLGEFLLPGLTQQKMIYASNLDVDSVRLHLVDSHMKDTKNQQGQQVA